MENLEKYNQVFATVFKVEVSKLNSDFGVGNVDNWDSIAQLNLVTEMEDAFDIMLDTEDILGFKSYDIGKQILAKHAIVV